MTTKQYDILKNKLNLSLDMIRFVAQNFDTDKIKVQENNPRTNQPHLHLELPNKESISINNSFKIHVSDNCPEFCEAFDISEWNYELQAEEVKEFDIYLKKTVETLKNAPQKREESILENSIFPDQGDEEMILDNTEITEQKVDLKLASTEIEGIISEHNITESQRNTNNRNITNTQSGFQPQ